MFAFETVIRHHGLNGSAIQFTALFLLPAMTLSDRELEEGCDILSDVLRNYSPAD
jgi:4-aminobutyrate aminotransferase-like enzyme